MSSNSGSGVQGLNLGNIFDSITKSITHNNSLNFLMRNGNYGVPYAFMGMVTVVAATFTYVTYKDYSDEIAEGVSETLDSIQATELFTPSDNDSADTIPLFESIPKDPVINDDVIINPEEKPEEKAEEKPEEKAEEKPEEKAEEKAEEKPEEKAEEKPEEKAEEKKEEKKENEPGEKYKLGGRSKKKRNHKGSMKKRRKRQN